MLMFSQALKALTADDIRRVVQEEEPEDGETEFKETLPCKIGNDPWI